MNIDLLSIINNEGSEVAFNGEVYTQEDNPFDEKISVKSQVSGKVKNFSDRLELTAKVTAVVTAVCARCVAPLTTDLSFEVNEVIGEDEVTLDGTILDVDSIVAKNVFMNLPMKFLCSEDCKGLCPKCGENLNIEECKCDNDEIDERFAALKKLLD